MRICMVGLGKIGLPLAGQFATKGHRVVEADVNPTTVELVNDGAEPFPGETHLEELLRRCRHYPGDHQEYGRLTGHAVPGAKVVLNGRGSLSFPVRGRRIGDGN